MIIVTGEMELTPAEIPAFEREYRAMRDKVLAEDGCGHYSLLVEDPARGIVNVVEFWDSEADLLTHFKQPWIISFLSMFGGHLKRSTVQVYDVAAARPLPGT